MKPILLLGEARGKNEDKIKSSFVGQSGVLLLNMLGEAGVIDLTPTDRDYIYRFYQHSDPQMIEMVWQLHPEIARTNVFNLHPPRDRIETFCGPRAEGISGYPALLTSKYVRQEFIPELERLADEIVDLDPNLIIALGNTALWALCGTTGISKLRGTTRLSTHTATGFKVLPTYHPAAVGRQWELRPTTVMDLAKASREALFPEIRRPKREIWIEPTLQDIQDFVDAHVRGCSILAVDIETAGNQVTCIGLAPRTDLALVVPFFDARAKNRSYWPTRDDEVNAWKPIRDVLTDGSIPKVFQNGLYDIAFLWRAQGIGVKGATHDTMLLSHALEPESLKGLGYLGSIYSDEGAWKQERKGTSTIKRDE